MEKALRILAKPLNGFFGTCSHPFGITKRGFVRFTLIRGLEDEENKIERISIG